MKKPYTFDQCHAFYKRGIMSPERWAHVFQRYQSYPREDKTTFRYEWQIPEDKK